MVTASGQSEFDLRLNLNPFIVRQYTELDLHVQALANLTDLERIKAVKDIVSKLISNGLAYGHPLALDNQTAPSLNILVTPESLVEKKYG